VNDLVDLVDICKRWQISRARFYVLAGREGFPAPEFITGNGTRVWSMAKVDACRTSLDRDHRYREMAK
jgi:predicted DNA-binding transcriptional regulator AlpA